MSLFEPQLPPGLLYIPEWLSQLEHDAALQEVDSLPFDESLSRRVQHYGAKYDYSFAKVDERGTAPEIPPCLSKIGERLLNEGFFEAEPDQVIVNEYLEDQGIAAHIDRLTFGEAVATVSLLEMWPMDFVGPDGEKLEVLLGVRSLAVMQGESRKTWTHAIPKRKTDVVGGLKQKRVRRVSLTFRTLPID